MSHHPGRRWRNRDCTSWALGRFARRSTVGLRTTKAANRLPALEVVIENRGDVRVIELSNGRVGLVQNLQFQAVRNGKTLDVFDTAILKLPEPCPIG